MSGFKEKNTAEGDAVHGPASGRKLMAAKAERAGEGAGEAAGAAAGAGAGEAAGAG